MNSKRKATLPFVALALAVTIPAASQTLATAKAESVGMSSEHLARIDTLMQRHICDGNMANALTLVMRNGKVVH